MNEDKLDEILKKMVEKVEKKFKQAKPLHFEEGDPAKRIFKEILSEFKKLPAAAAAADDKKEFIKRRGQEIAVVALKLTGGPTDKKVLEALVAFWSLENLIAQIKKMCEGEDYSRN